MTQLPQGWRQTTVGEIIESLPESKKTMETIIAAINAGGDVSSVADRLKAIFRLHAESLAKIQIDPDYLAYALANTVQARHPNLVKQNNN